MSDNILAGQDDISTPSGLPAEAMEAITSKMDEVFGSGASAKDDVSDEKREAPVAAPVPAAEKYRQQSVKKEQGDELEEEGLTSLDNPEGNVAKDDKSAATVAGEDGDDTLQGADGANEAHVALDPNLRFVAQQFGWTDEKIEKLMKADPELATDTFSRMADAYTNLSRQMIPGTPQNAGLPQNQQTAQPGAKPSPLDQLLSPEAMVKFAEVNGESMVDGFLKPFAAERQAMRSEISELKAYVEVQQRRAVASEAGAVLDTLRKDFGDLYGKDTLQLTQGQIDSRSHLANIADQLRAGAKQQGRELSVTEALNRAHLIVSADYRQQAVRKSVTEQVQKRSKQITAAPSQRRNPSLTGVKSDAAAAEAYARKAAELGIAD